MASCAARCALERETVECAMAEQNKMWQKRWQRWGLRPEALREGNGGVRVDPPPRVLFGAATAHAACCTHAWRRGSRLWSRISRRKGRSIDAQTDLSPTSAGGFAAVCWLCARLAFVHAMAVRLIRLHPRTIDAPLRPCCSQRWPEQGRGQLRESWGQSDNGAGSRTARGRGVEGVWVNRGLSTKCTQDRDQARETRRSGCGDGA